MSALLPVGDGGAEKIIVTPEIGPDLANVFGCEGGEFHVSWSGVVGVPETIYIGRGTTVWIVGGNASSNSSLGASTDGDQQEHLEGLSTNLPPLPNGLAAAAVRTASDPQLVAQLGPIFFVDGGQLFLEGLALRGGNATASSADNVVVNNSSSSSITGGDAVVSGGGIHAIDANVTVTGCEFEDNFAGHLGGGVFANRSYLVVVGSVFRRCHADTVPSPEEDVEGAGGGIGVSLVSQAYLRWNTRYRLGTSSGSLRRCLMDN